jgi:hypothetical protein
LMCNNALEASFAVGGILPPGRTAIGILRAGINHLVLLMVVPGSINEREARAAGDKPPFLAAIVMLGARYLDWKESACVWDVADLRKKSARTY